MAETHAVHKVKHPAYSRMLEQRNLEGLQRAGEMVKACEQTVQRARELMQESQQARDRARALKRH
jgi:hypothetical protein